RVGQSYILSFLLYCAGYDPHLHSFPTRRSSDLDCGAAHLGRLAQHLPDHDDEVAHRKAVGAADGPRGRREQLASEAREADPDRKIGRAQSELQSRENLVCRLLLEKKKRVKTSMS